MCGITGIIGSGAELRVLDISAMNTALRHRGPDDHGIFTTPAATLGHTRLSILDLSPDGHQPMSSPCGRFTLVYNGEIYNYRELRLVLADSWCFHSSGDTEVLLAAYVRWGAECLSRLRGMFAFAVWDRDRRELFLARDRFGIKPLYYGRVNGCFTFASEIKAIIAAGATTTVNRETVAEYLTSGLTDQGEDTFFAGIRRLPAGNCMLVDAQGEIRRISSYYRIEDRIRTELRDIDESAAVAVFRDKLTEAVGMHLRADVPVGMTMSGGVDSSALLALSCRLTPDITHFRAYSFVSDDSRYSERDRIEKALEGRGITMRFNQISPDRCLELMDQTTYSQEAPFGGVPTIAMFDLYRQAKADGTIVLLNGAGADDYLAGSRREVLIYLAELTRRGGGALLRREIEGFLAMWGGSRDDLEKAIGSILGGGAKALGADGTTPTCIRAVRPEFRRPADFTIQANGDEGLLRNALRYRLAAGKLPRALRFDDHNAMAASCEVRVPFLDHELVELAFSLPERLLVSAGCGKYILRQALNGLVPEEIRIAPKHNIQSPQREWLKQEPFRSLVLRVLDEPVDLVREAVDMVVARAAYQAYLGGDDANSNFIWQWLSLDAWSRAFLGPVER